MHILVYTTQHRAVETFWGSVECCTTFVFEEDIIAYIFDLQYPLSYFNLIAVMWSSGCLMDCHATNRGSIPGGDCKIALHVLRMGQ